MLAIRVLMGSANLLVTVMTVMAVLSLVQMLRIEALKKGSRPYDGSGTFQEE